MNFDLIEKLIRLANNNPNENEANLAARKVCRLLAEGNFKFNNHTEPPLRGRSPVQPDVRSASNPYAGFNPFEDFFKARQWDSYKKPPNQAYPKYSWFDENYKPKTASEQNEERQKYYSSKKWPGNDPFTKPSEQKEERLLKCKTCGNSKLTKFVGLAELYECNNCQWTAYTKSKKQSI
jgi:hypothetical protein